MAVHHIIRKAGLAGCALCLGMLTASCALAQSVGQSSTIEAGTDNQFPLVSEKMQPLATQIGGVQVTPEDFDKVKLSASCVLIVDVVGFPDMSNVERRLNAEGQIQMPSAGSINLKGLTLAQAESAIASALVERQVVKSLPQVNVRIVEVPMKVVNVLGEVRAPGRIQVVAPKHLSDILASAGGESFVAGKDVEIQHTDEQGATTIQHVEYAPGLSTSPLQDVMVQPGDTVLVHRAGAVYVLGAVGKPGGYLMVGNSAPNVMQALSLAGGLALDASADHMRIIRPKGNGFEEIKVPFIRSGNLTSSNVQLQLNDVLFVPRSKWKTVVVDGSTILGASVGAILYRVP